MAAAASVLPRTRFPSGVLLPQSVTGLIGGYQAGYNLLLPNKVVIGAADISFTSPLDRPMASSNRLQHDI